MPSLPRPPFASLFARAARRLGPRPVVGLTLVLGALGSLGGCSRARLPEALQPEVRHGPGASVKPKRVLVLASTCGSMATEWTTSTCNAGYTSAVDSIVRSSLEFAGYSIVDSNTLRLATRSRQEEQTTEVIASSRTSREEISRPIVLFNRLTEGESEERYRRDTTSVVLSGANFEDLSVEDRKQVLEQAGTDSVANVRIAIGGQAGSFLPRHSVEVMVRLGTNRGDEMAWAARCQADSREFGSVSLALEHAARCAMHGALATP